MTLADLLVESDDMRHSAPRTSHPYEYYTRSLAKYIPWMKEQISKSKEGFIRIKRGDLAIAIKKVVLFNEGIFVELSHYDRERIFMMRYRIPDDSIFLCR